MTTTDSYHTRMVAPESSPQASDVTGCGIAAALRSNRGDVIPEVTEQEEEAWLTKMQQLAGCVA